MNEPPARRPMRADARRNYASLLKTVRVAVSERGAALSWRTLPGRLGSQSERCTATSPRVRISLLFLGIAFAPFVVAVSR